MNSIDTNWHSMRQGMDYTNGQYEIANPTVFGLAVVLALLGIFVNILLIAVVLAAEKITRNATAVLFTCSAHLYLCTMVLLQWSVYIHRTNNSTPPSSADLPDVAANLEQTNYNHSLYLKQAAGRPVAQVSDLTNISSKSFEHQVSGPSEWSCEAYNIIVCVKIAANLWSCLSLLLLTLNQYIYIEAPFWYDIRVSQKVVILSYITLGVVCHIIGFTPLMWNSKLMEGCHMETAILQLPLSATVLILQVVVLLVIVFLSIRMLYLAMKHRRKMREYNNITVTKNDSHRFFLLMLSGFCISYLIPAVVLLVSVSMGEVIPVMHLESLLLVGPIWFALLYGSRFPNGFKSSVRLAVCCCLPVKTESERQMDIENAVRFAMMRLGHVMVRIDEQAAQKRYTTFVKRKTRVQKTLSALKKPKQQSRNPKMLQTKKKSISNPDILLHVNDRGEDSVKRHRTVRICKSDRSPLVKQKSKSMTDDLNHIDEVKDITVTTRYGSAVIELSVETKRSCFTPQESMESIKEVPEPASSESASPEPRSPEPGSEPTSPVSKTQGGMVNASLDLNDEQTLHP